MKVKHPKHFIITAVIITALLKFILMDWLHWRGFYITGISIFWIGYIMYRRKTHGEMKQLWSIQHEHFKQSVLILAPFVLLSILVILLYSSHLHQLYFSWHIIPVLLLYPIWGIIQQYLMLGIISQSLITIEGVNFNRRLVILTISILFSLVHYPSYILMVFTFFMEMVFVSVYLRWKSLLIIGIAHGWIATFLLYYVMERDLWSELFSLL